MKTYRIISTVLLLILGMVCVLTLPDPLSWLAGGTCGIFAGNQWAS